MALPGRRQPDNNVIAADTLGTTTVAGIGASIAAISGAVVALLPTFAGMNVPDSLKVAGIAVVGLATVAWAIATAGDALARAYATAHVEPGKTTPALPAALAAIAASYERAVFGVAGDLKDGSDTKTPALAAAIQRLADAHETSTFGVVGKLKDESDTKTPALAAAIRRLADAHETSTFGVVGKLKDQSDTKTPALAEAVKAFADHMGNQRSGGHVIQAPNGLTVSVDGTEFTVAALRVSATPPSMSQLYFDNDGVLHSTPAILYDA